MNNKALFQDSLRVLARSSLHEANCDVVFKDGVTPHVVIDKKQIFLPPTNGMDQKSITMSRAYAYHEIAHMTLTEDPQKYISKDENTLFRIWNVLEDARIEKVYGNYHLGCKSEFYKARCYINKKTGREISEQNGSHPISESLYWLFYVHKGITPAWNLSSEAKTYVDLFHDIFFEIDQANTSRESLDIAKKICKLISKKTQNGIDDSEENINIKELIDEDLNHLDTIKNIIEFIKKSSENLKSNERYTSCRENDIFIFHKPNKFSKEVIKNDKKFISSKIFEMSRALNQALRVMMKSKKHCFLRTGSLDFDYSLVEMGSNLRRNVFYKESSAKKINTAISICIDQSRSMKNQINEIRRMILAIGDSLVQIRIPFEIVGSTTLYGNGNPEFDRLRKESSLTRFNPIQYYVYKMFQDNWMVNRSNLGNLSYYNHNVDGETIELCTCRLMQRSEKRKIIFSFSDGNPYDGVKENKFILGQNIKTACENARINGIEVYGFGINTKDPEEYYGRDNFIFLKDVSSMDQDFFRTFSEIITKGRFKV